MIRPRIRLLHFYTLFNLFWLRFEFGLGGGGQSSSIITTGGLGTGAEFDSVFEFCSSDPSSLEEAAASTIAFAARVESKSTNPKAGIWATMAVAKGSIMKATLQWGLRKSQIEEKKPKFSKMSTDLYDFLGLKIHFTTRTCTVRRRRRLACSDPPLSLLSSAAAAARRALALPGAAAGSKKPDRQRGRKIT